jgi:hypothetical protein
MLYMMPSDKLGVALASTSSLGSQSSGMVNANLGYIGPRQ